MRNRGRIEGRKVEEKIIEKKQLSVAIRPSKIAFIIPGNIKTGKLLNLIKYNTHIWGGYFNVFIPVKRGEIAVDWWKLLLRSDPDGIYLVNEISDDLSRQINQVLQPLFVYNWDDATLEELLNRDTDRRARTINIAHLLVEEFRNIYFKVKSNIALCNISTGNLFYSQVLATFGILDTGFAQWYKERLKAQSFNYTNGNLGKFLKNFFQVKHLLKPIDLTWYRLNATLHNSLSFSAGNILDIFLSGKKFIDDFCLFWYFRGHNRKSPLFLPLEELQQSQNIKVFKKWLKISFPKVNYLRFYCSSLKFDEARKFVSLLETVLNDYCLHIKFCNFDSHDLGWLAVSEHQEVSETTFVDNQYRLKVSKPQGVEIGSMDSWIMDIDIRNESKETKGYKIPKVDSFSKCFRDQSSFPPHHMKISNYHTFSVPVYKGDEFINLFLKSPRELFGSLLADCNCKFEVSEKTKYAEGIIKLAKRLFFFNIFQDQNTRDLFRNMAKEKLGCSFPKINKTLPKTDTQETKEFISELTQLDIFLRGYNLLCPHCSLARWYSVTEIAEVMTCPGCLSKFQIPVDLRFDYKLNELFSRGIEQGAIPVILTILFLRNLSKESFLYTPGIKIQGPAIVDTDIMALCDRHLVLCECKDLENGCSSKDFEEIKNQFQKLFDFSKKIGGEIVFFSSLLQDPDKIKEIEKLANLLGKNYRIRASVLSGKDLEKGIKTVTHQLNRKPVDFHLSIKNFCPAPPVLSEKCEIFAGKPLPKLRINI